MAIFEGSIQEFHDFIGPRIRNKVNEITRNARKAKNETCENCNRKGELQAAHIHGKERRLIIENSLAKYNINGTLKVDIRIAEEEILKNHLPVSETFLFLCPICHSEYDQKKSAPNNLSTQSDFIKEGGIVVDNEFLKLYKIRLWSAKPSQINHKIIRAYLSLEKLGPVNIDNLRQKCSIKGSNYYVHLFDGNFASMKTEKGNSHGKVFFVDKNAIVGIYPQVRKEIDKWFL